MLQTPRGTVLLMLLLSCIFFLYFLFNGEWLLAVVWASLAIIDVFILYNGDKPDPTAIH